MYVVHNRIDVPAERAEAFERMFVENMRTSLSGVPGLRRATLQRPTKPGVPYVATMEFEDQEAFTAWLSSDSFRASHSNAGAPGTQAPSGLETFDLLEEYTG